MRKVKVRPYKKVKVVCSDCKKKDMIYEGLNRMKDISFAVILQAVKAKTMLRPGGVGQSHLEKSVVDLYKETKADFFKKLDGLR